MTRVVVYVREVGGLKPEFSLEFELPEVPKVGSYISVHRPDIEPHSEDMIVEKVWWRLHHPQTGGIESEPRKIGSVKEIIVECVQATGPWSSDRWRDTLDQHSKRGAVIPQFEVARLSVRQDAFATKKDNGTQPGYREATEEDFQ